MTHRVSANFSWIAAAIALACGGFTHPLLAQGPSPDTPTLAVESTIHQEVVSPRIESEHHFWNNKNKALFATVAALNAADFAVTRENLQAGGQELNPIVRVFGRSTSGLAVNFAGETAGVIGISYFFHRTGHHKLERAVSLLNIGSSAGAVTYDLTHR
jgi:hypothetical protein